MKTALEDTLPDILKKAFIGHLADQRLIPNTEAARQLQSFIEQTPETSEETLQQIATALDLDVESLLHIRKEPCIEEQPLPEGCHKVESPFRSWSVNAFVLQIPGTGDSLIFDACERPDELLSFLDRSKLNPQAIYITHGHPDHIGGLQDLLRCFPGTPVFASNLGKMAGAQPIAFHKAIRWGSLSLLPFPIPGHSDDGTAFFVNGCQQPLIIPGDAIFARSVGNIRSHYFQSLKIIRDTVLSLPGDTRILPGHGPVTEVASERAYNPFFAGKP